MAAKANACHALMVRRAHHEGCW